MKKNMIFCWVLVALALGYDVVCVSNPYLSLLIILGTFIFALTWFATIGEKK